MKGVTEMRKLILLFFIKGLQLVMHYLLRQNGYDLQNSEVLRYNHLLDKYVVAYQKRSIPIYPFD